MREQLEKALGGAAALEQEHKHYIQRVKVQGDRVKSFACSKHASFMLMKGKDVITSMDPEKYCDTGLTHFYSEEHPDKVIDGKKARVWKFISA